MEHQEHISLIESVRHGNRLNTAWLLLLLTLLSIFFSTTSHAAGARMLMETRLCAREVQKHTTNDEAQAWCSYFDPTVLKPHGVLSVPSGINWFTNVQDESFRNTRTALKYLKNGFTIDEAITLANENPHWYQSRTVGDFFSGSTPIYILLGLIILTLLYIINRLLTKIRFLEDTCQTIGEQLATLDPPNH